VARLQDFTGSDHLEQHGDGLLLSIHRSPTFRGGRASSPSTRQIGPADNAAALLREAHRLLKSHSMSPLDPQAHAAAIAPASQRQRYLMALGLLAPAIQRRIADGRLTASRGYSAAEMPLAWADQLKTFGAG